MDTAEFRAACGHFPTGVAVVTCSDPAGTPIGLTVNSFTSVSLKPPMILFCVDHSAFSRKVIASVETFAVNLLSLEQKDLSSRFAKPSDDRFQNVAFKLGTLGAPLLDGALVHLECRKAHTYEAGDHDIVVGEVIDLTIQPDDAQPLVYFKGQYRELS